MSDDTQIIAAECPVPVVLSSWGIYPLTPCCRACAKGWTDDGGGVVCKGCFEWVDDLFGTCWEPDEEYGWLWYQEMLQIAGETPAKATEIAAHVREKVLAAMAPDQKPPRCQSSGFVRPIDRDEWVKETPMTECARCGNQVKCRVRGSDTPPLARILPHRIDGVPCR
jgi:hypothetical protein